MHPEEPFLDPYHTYLSLAATSMFPPPESTGGGTWTIEPLDPLINAKLGWVHGEKRKLCVIMASERLEGGWILVHNLGATLAWRCMVFRAIEYKDFPPHCQGPGF